MKNTLVVVADLGGYKAFRLENTALHRTPRLELLEQFDSSEAHGKIVDKVTDLAGRFRRPTGAANSTGAMSNGERHNVELELRKRLVRRLAQRLNRLARPSQVECCFLAASKEINHQLIQELEPKVRAKVEKNLPADLTKIQHTKILRRF